jgi:DNA-binding CsgD family transcriptional regulator
MEAQLASVLIDGQDLNAACGKMGISRATARTHLASLFSKLGVRKQGELIALLLRGQAGLRRDPIAR